MVLHRKPPFVQTKNGTVLFSVCPMRFLLTTACSHKPVTPAPFCAKSWLLASVGAKAQGVYLADKEFAGEEPHAVWRERFGAEVITPPHQSSRKPWPKEWRRWLAHLRQLVETVYAKLLNTFRLARERPHTLTGFQARLAEKISLHNFCIWLNGALQREPLAFADLIDW